VVEADLGAGWRTVLHQRMAEALTAQAGRAATRVAGQPRRPPGRTREGRRTREGGALRRADGRSCPSPGGTCCRGGSRS
jgi:hypothetical protein